jgi:hypothetical protein
MQCVNTLTDCWMQTEWQMYLIINTADSVICLSADQLLDNNEHKHLNVPLL